MSRRIGCVFAGGVMCALACVALALNCKDDSGASVDWWVILKMPQGGSRLVSSNSSSAAGGASVLTATDGTEYAFADSSSSGSFALSGKSIEDSNGALGQTLGALYKAAKTDGFIFYNDEDPSGGAPSDCGHSKGVVGWDASGGFWLVHSIPKYPGDTSSGSIKIEPGELIYGQSMLCMSLSLAQLDTVGVQLAYNQIHIYDSHMPSDETTKLANLEKVIQGFKQTTAGTSVKTLGKFTSFAKTSQWGQDLYSNLVETHYKIPMYLETWMRPAEPNCCAKSATGGAQARQCEYTSYNVQTLQVAGVAYGETQDHSKWGINAGSSPAVVCIGDINRMTSQYGRGGGTVCTEDATLFKMFQSAIQTYEKC